ncbi:SRPBCC family protein [Thermoleophilia bacterium SCSIO 60948]|nr:SRPBCC family protein [Thermoleophilia bacterium SCSIO 60948]
MAGVGRTRTIAASPRRVWDLVSDPYGFARWWPRAIRVEDVVGRGDRARWTLVLQTEKGRPVRLDYRATAATDERRFVWSQEIEGTPFERILRSAELELLLEPVGDEATSVELIARDRLRGLSRLGKPMMKSAGRNRLDAALDGLEQALVGEPGATGTPSD